jgi:trimethylamine:corrinoid methyltransferase-like protein
MMINRAIRNFDKSILDQIHNHSLELLKESGIRFHSEKTLEAFILNGNKWSYVKQTGAQDKY